MPKALCILGMVVSGLTLLLFGLDLATGLPFGGVSMVVDIVFVVASAVLGYLGWSTFREQI